MLSGKISHKGERLQCMLADENKLREKKRGMSETDCRKLVYNFTLNVQKDRCQLFCLYIFAINLHAIIIFRKGMFERMCVSGWGKVNKIMASDKNLVSKTLIIIVKKETAQTLSKCNIERVRVHRNGTGTDEGDALSGTRSIHQTKTRFEKKIKKRIRIMNWKFLSGQTHIMLYINACKYFILLIQWLTAIDCQRVQSANRLGIQLFERSTLHDMARRILWQFVNSNEKNINMLIVFTWGLVWLSAI